MFWWFSSRLFDGISIQKKDIGENVGEADILMSCQQNYEATRSSMQ